MAQTVHLKLKAGGSDIKGESSQLADGRKDTIECVYFESGVTTPRDAGSGRSTGRRQFSPIKIRKRIDKASPLLAKALTQSEKCEGEFDFFRPAQDGTDEIFFAIKIGGAFVSDVTLYMPDTLENPGKETREAYEEVTFTFDSITWEHKTGGTMHSDSWSGAK